MATSFGLSVSILVAAAGVVPAIDVAAAVAPSCPLLPAPVASGLGDVAYVRGRALHAVDLSSGMDRTVVTNAVPLHQAPGTPITVRWSPDGRWIAFGAAEVVSAGGGAVCRPLGRSVVSWSWSPTSDGMVGVTRSGGLIVGGPARAPFPLVPAGWGASAEFGPAFDPTGRYVAVGRIRTDPSVPAQGSLWVVDLSTGHTSELFHEREALPIVAGWSPDGSWILSWNDIQFSSSVAADGLALRATSVDGSTTSTIASRVLVHPDFLSWCGDRLVVAAGGFRDVRSGKRLIVASPPDWRASPLSQNLSRDWIWPSCSPDGRWVAATAGVAPPPQAPFGRERRTIWLVASDGSTRSRLLDDSNAFANEFARWSTDGSSILFVRRTLATVPTAALFLATVDPSTGALFAVRGPITQLGPIAPTYEAGYGYDMWSAETDWFQPGS